MSTERNNRVLVIDDTEDIHRVFRRLLAPKPKAPALGDLESALFGTGPELHDASFEVSSALQGRQGLELVRTALAEGRPYAMAFVDMRMPPGWDGLQTIQNIWVDDPDLEIVICTAFSDHTDRDIVQRLGHSDQVLFLRKPFESIEARQLARALTEKWSLRQQARLRMAALERAVATRTRELSEINLRLVEPQESKTASCLAKTPEEDLGRLMAGLSRELEIAVQRLEATLVGAGAETLHATRQLSGIVQGMLRLSGGSSLPQRTIDLNNTISTILEVMREGIESCGQLETSLGDLPPLRCAPAELNLVLLGLLDGAVQAVNATSPGLRNGRISVTTRTAGASAVLTIADTGTPVPSGERDRIFDPYYTPEAGHRPGLHLARRIVVEHGGTIDIDTDDGGRFRVLIHLPIEEDRLVKAG